MTGWKKKYECRNNIKMEYKMVNNIKKKVILVITAHPDDLEFGCSGTVAKFAKEGYEIFSLIITDGSKGSHILKLNSAKLVKVREEEAKKSADILGIKDVFFLKFKDGEIENTLNLRKEIVKIIRKVKPYIVFGFDPTGFNFENPYRSHRDHRVAAETVFDAVYPAAGNISFFPELIKQKYLPHQIEEIWFFAAEKPNRIIDISQTIQLKIKALLQYASQVDPAAIAKRIKSMARRFAGKKKYVEAFRVMKFNH